MDSRVLGLMVSCVLGLALSASPAAAAVFPAACTGTTGNPASLISAINQANAAGGPDVVRLGQRCTYAMSSTDNGWYGLNALPAVASTVTLEGNGSTITRATGAPSMRFFFVGADPTATATSGYVTPGAGSLTLRNVTLRGGSVRGGSATAGGGGAGMGGAIFNQGQLTIESTTLTANAAQGGEGGGSVGGNAGGGMAISSNGSSGGGMGSGLAGSNPPRSPEGGAGGPVGGGAGGGGGIRTGQTGAPGGGSAGSAGGGPATGTGGLGGSGAPAGDGSGGGGNGAGSGTLVGGAGGDFSMGGTGPGTGGGGGVGGGGGSTGDPGATGGGGGFGGGGGWGIAGGGSGGFGGGAGGTGGSGSAGAPGFAGGSAVGGPPRGGGGGGLGGAVFNMQGTLTIRNSTLTANSALGGASPPGADPGKGLGGAIFNLSGTVAATSATIAGNTTAPDTPLAEGTAIYNLGYDAATARTAQITLRNSILGEGTSGDDTLVSSRSSFINPTPNLSSAAAAIGERNLVRSTSTLDGGTITGTPLTADPRLGPLALAGGLTPTMAPAANSSAIDAGSAFGLTTDQRGLRRPVNIPTTVNFGDGADIGAVERQVPSPPSTGGGSALASFGSSTRLSLRLASGRIPARGPVSVRVANRNSFTVVGRLSGQTRGKLRVKRGKPKRRVALRARTFTVRGASRKTVRLKLPRVLRRRLARTGRLSLRLTARVEDPAGNRRTVRKSVRPKLKRRRAKR